MTGLWNPRPYPGLMAVDRSRKARSARRRKRRMGRVEHDLSEEQWTTLKTAWGGCAYCGAADKPLQRDCVLAISRGGRYTLDNIAPACGSCNASKGNYEVTGWLRRKAARRRRLFAASSRDQRRAGTAVPWRSRMPSSMLSHPRTNDGWRGSFEPLGTLWLTRLIGPIRVTSAVRTDLNWRGYPWLGSSSAIGERTARVTRVAFTIGLAPGSAMTCSWTSMRSGQASISPG